MRSMLFVPGDRPERFEKAEASGADAVILDLEDAVAAPQRPRAREAIATHLRRSARPVPLWVRINPVDSADALADLSSVVSAKPDGVVLPKARNGHDVSRLDHWLEALEATHGLEVGSIPLIPMITETAGAMLQLASFVPTPARVVGMTWGAEDLAAELGAAASRDEAGRYEMPYQMASAGCLVTATAAGVSAIDTVDTEIKDIAAVEQRARASRRSGYTAKLAIHPAQIAALHAAFTPSADEIAHAEAVLAAFSKSPDAGALRVDGKLVDRPHVLQAERVLAAARRR
ncbi:MAG: CoA ester lyase [Gammaproteobacteria bacterium]|jgi:citrate lyase subunit beta / citryl-CoA lyase|nr:CoA ester lyase [Gammaproteobacteria bacterium]